MKVGGVRGGMLSVFIAKEGVGRSPIAEELNKKGGSPPINEGGYHDRKKKVCKKTGRI
jgi:hypothetical protein